MDPWTFLSGISLWSKIHPFIFYNHVSLANEQFEFRTVWQFWFIFLKPFFWFFTMQLDKIEWFFWSKSCEKWREIKRFSQANVFFLLFDQLKKMWTEILSILNPHCNNPYQDVNVTKNHWKVISSIQLTLTFGFGNVYYCKSTRSLIFNLIETLHLQKYMINNTFVGQRNKIALVGEYEC